MNTLNGHVLTHAESITLHVALATLRDRMSEKGALGDDAVGESLRAGYERCAGDLLEHLVITTIPRPSGL
jgi:hypothetical protein